MEEELRLTRRRVLGSLVTVGGAGAAAGAGTMAALSDTESSSGNGIQAGTLDLEVDGQNTTVTFLDVSEIKPGDQGSGDLVLANVGTATGSVSVTVDAIRDYENGYDGNENAGRDGTRNDGELDEYLEVKGTVGSDVVWSRQTVADLAETTYTPGTTIAGGNSKTFTLSWWLADDTSMAQGDSVEIDLTFSLDQTGGA
jgi:predicted ribosomally synthesized peptide with SipW-like signal peptide